MRCADDGRIIHDSATKRQLPMGLAGACERELQNLKAIRCRTRPPSWTAPCRACPAGGIPPLWVTHSLLARRKQARFIHDILKKRPPLTAMPATSGIAHEASLCSADVVALDNHAGSVRQHHERGMDVAELSRQVRRDAGVSLRESADSRRTVRVEGLGTPGSEHLAD